jgi:hypothetical protein
MRSLFAVMAAMIVVPVAGSAHAAAPDTCTGKTPTFSKSDAFGENLEGSYVLVPFDVPEGVTKVRAVLCHDQPPSPTSARIKHTLDLGLYQAVGTDETYDEDEFRGWGGSSRLDVAVSPHTATAGFLPGEIPAGHWAAEIGVAAVAGPTEGDPDGSVGWRLEVFLSSNPEDAAEPWQPVPYDTSPVRSEPGWYKGDFHVHSEHSGMSVSMEETVDFAFGEAKLDFITLSDYVTSRHWAEIGALRARHPNNLIVRSAEIITYRGHVNNHASATYVDYRTGPVYELTDKLREVGAAQPASRIFDDIHAGGGFTQVNHPTTFPSSVPGFANLCRGCSWDYSDEETDWAKVDAMEVQTGPSGTSEPRGHELGPNPFTPLAIEWWDRLNRQGFDITGVGSSDAHDAAHTQPQDVTHSPIGEATTVVYASELSEAGIRDAIEAGHAYVKFFVADGPDLRFEAVATSAPGRGNGDGRPRGIMGDDLPVASARFTATVLGAVPSPEIRLLLVFKDGEFFLARPVSGDPFVFEFDSAGAGDYRLQLMRGTAIEALTNPITLEPKLR